MELRYYFNPVELEIWIHANENPDIYPNKPGWRKKSISWHYYILFSVLHLFIIYQFEVAT